MCAGEDLLMLKGIVFFWISKIPLWAFDKVSSIRWIGLHLWWSDALSWPWGIPDFTSLRRYRSWCMRKEVVLAGSSVTLGRSAVQSSSFNKWLIFEIAKFGMSVCVFQSINLAFCMVFASAMPILAFLFNSGLDSMLWLNYRPSAARRVRCGCATSVWIHDEGGGALAKRFIYNAINTRGSIRVFVSGSISPF